MIRRFAVALLVVAGCVAATPTGSTATIGDEWAARADRAIAQAVELDTPGVGTVFNWSYLASAIAQRSPQGWQDPRALAYMHKVLNRRHSDGGFGLDRPHDLFGDGTINPANTAYTVTMADHVGKMFLEAHAAGALHRYYVDTLLAKLQSIPRVPVAGGYCFAYTDQVVDAANAGMCIHNANAGVAEFLSLARDAGFEQASQWSIMQIVRHETAAYRYWDRSWPYRGNTGTWGDADHNAYVVEAMMQVSPGLAEAALVWMNSRWQDVTSAEAHVRLAKFDCAGSMRWLPEYDTRVASSSWVWRSLDRMAYLSRLAADAAAACG